MRVMFVCTGNICRSAVAEGLFIKLIKDNNLKIDVYSCGIYAENGDYATYNAIEAARYYDADISNHRATNIRSSQIEDMDIILCATNAHKNMVISMYPELISKVYTMKEYADIDDNGRNMDINDPWGHDMYTYKKCAQEINVCLENIIDKWL